MIEVKASGPPHVLTLEVGGKQGHAPCEILLLKQVNSFCKFLCMSFTKLTEC